jgi:hypothetical protein
MKRRKYPSFTTILSPATFLEHPNRKPGTWTLTLLPVATTWASLGVVISAQVEALGEQAGARCEQARRGRAGGGATWEGRGVVWREAGRTRQPAHKRGGASSEQGEISLFLLVFVQCIPMFFSFVFLLGLIWFMNPFVRASNEIFCCKVKNHVTL